MKAIALVVVEGGVAYVDCPYHVQVEVIDIDNLSASGKKATLLRDQGFEELVARMGVKKYVRWSKQ